MGMKDYQALIVSHTHWDREWYISFQETRAKLINVIDEILETLHKDKKFKNFTLDGQTIILEDYLEIKKERKKEIEHFIKEGRILIGPWYVQMDEFLECDEAIIRNLLIGINEAKKYGKVMLIGYVPDSFGHISQLPQILQGFGIRSFVFTRGMGDKGEKLKTEFVWRAPDGSEVLAIHLIKGYCNADLEKVYLFGKSRNEIRKDPKEIIPIFEWLKSELLPKASTNCILLMNGCDHTSIQPEVTYIIKILNKIFKKNIFVQGSLIDYIKKIKKSKVKLSIYEGELRGARYHPILTNVFSSRIYLKQENVTSQILLQYYAEPLATYAWVLGNSYPYDLLLKTWKYLIQNHAHDSICGTCIDEVHKENLLRFFWVKQIAEYVIKESIKFLSNKIKPINQKARSTILVYNPLNWERSEIVEIKISKPLSKFFRIKDNNGMDIPFQIIDSDSNKIDIIFIAKDVPPCGYKIFSIIESNEIPEFSSKIKYNENEIENEFFKIKANPKKGGCLSIFDKRYNYLYENMNILEDEGDAGDEYCFSPVSPIISNDDLNASIEIIEKGPIRATLRIKNNLKLPKEINEKGERDSETIDCQVIMDISIYSEVPRIDIKGEIDNKAKDHRLRAIFPTNFKIENVSHSFAHDQFFVIKRSIIPPKGENWIDKPPTTHPQRFFVDLNDGKNGLMIANKGLPEYEIINQGNLKIALTLLRCVGWLSRKETIGPVIPTPDAQCLGKNRFEYSIIPHNEDWLKSGAYKEAYNFNLPLMAFEVKLNGNEKLFEHSFIQIYPETLILTGVKRSEDWKNIVIRFYNISDEKILSRIKIFKGKDIYISSLNEENLLKIKSKYKINIDPYKIVTIKAKKSK